MDAGTVADLLERGSKTWHWLKCEGDFKGCPRAECDEASKAVAYLRQPDLVIARLALTVTNRGVRMTMPADEGAPSIASDNDPQAALQRAALPVHAAVEGAPKVTARCGRPGLCACPMEVSGLTGRSA